jgi:hypothetical protein
MDTLISGICIVWFIGFWVFLFIGETVGIVPQNAPALPASNRLLPALFWPAYLLGRMLGWEAERDYGGSPDIIRDMIADTETRKAKKRAKIKARHR